MESIKSNVKAYVVVATIVLLSGVSSAVDVAWIAHHAEGVGLQDRVRESAVDDQGNVYVTGTSYSGSRPDFATVKFDADGNQVWARRYDGPGGDGDEAVAIAVHPSRGVYVTGRSHGESGYKIVAIKYGLDGEELWVKAYPEAPDPAIWGVEPVDLAVDPDGTVYITGWGGGQGGVDIVTLAYDSDGSQLWTVFHEDDQGGASPIVVGADGVKVAGIAVGIDRVYVAGTSYKRFITLVYNTDGVKLWSALHGDPRSTTEDATAIAVDAAGFVYVTGRAYDTRASADYLTVKYDPDGNEVWVARFDGPVGKRDLANAIAVGGDGTVFVTGGSESRTGVDYATVKYDAGGNEAWVARYDGPASKRDEAFDLVVDAAGRIHVTGISYDVDGIDYATVVYAPDGTALSLDRFPARADIDLREEFPRIALAPNGETYVSGTWFDDTGDRDYVTIKYGAAGDRVWVARYDEPLVSGVEGLLVRTDSQGYAYLVANSLGPGGVWNTDYLVVKYDVNGAPLWTARYDDQIGSRDAASAFTFDAEGNTYVTGGSAGLGAESDYATAKYDPNGQQLWVARYDGPRSGLDGASAVAVDAMGNVYVTGTSSNCSGQSGCTLRSSDTLRDFATVKYDATGNELWVRRYDGPSHGWDGGTAIAVDDKGFVYVTGDAEGLRGPDRREANDYTTIKYDPDGNQVWLRVYDGVARGHDYPVEMTLTPEGLVVTGTSAGRNGRQEADDLATVMYDRDGNQLWVARFDGEASDAEWATGLALDEDGHIYVAGESVGLVTGRDYVVIKYDADGNELWVRTHDGPASDYDSAQAIDVDPSGRVAVTGFTTSFLDDVRRGLDYTTILYDTNGTELWVERHDGLAGKQDWARSVTFDGRGAIYVTGYTEGPEGRAATTIKYVDVANASFRRGDTNSDGAVNLTDAVFTLDALFAGAADALKCEKSADANDDGALNVADAVYLLGALFQGGAAPPEPARCGVDPTEDDLSCAEFPPCP